jgi:LysM repeat protein
MENSENKKGDDKTRIQFSSDQKNNSTSTNDDSTKIENDVNLKSTEGNYKNDSSDKKNSSVREDKVSKKSAIIGGVAAGVVGSAAGVASGAYFSDEIKNSFSQIESSAPESIAQEEQNNSQNQTDQSAYSSPESIAQEEHNNVHNTTTHTIDNSLEANPLVNNSVQSSLNIEYHDSAGSYEITCVDFNSDGKMDSMTLSAEMVDGTNITYTATGQELDQLLMGDVELASQNEYISFNATDNIDLDCGVLEVNDFTETSPYTIQPGDTLSEIAAQNNITVDELMAYNPNIDDPNVIYAGNELNIPNQNNDIFNPNNYDVIANEFSGFNGLNEINVESVEMNDTAYVQTDWQSFEDSPVNMSGINENYLAEMNDTNFDDFGSSNNYYDSSFGDSSVNLDFV